VEFTLYADGDIVTQDGQSTDNARDTWFKDGGQSVCGKIFFGRIQLCVWQT